MTKRLLSIGFIIALVASGWASVLAATMCPHDRRMTTVAAKGHLAPPAEENTQPEGHCSGSIKHAESQSQEVATHSGTEQTAEKSLGVPHQPMAACFHCMGAPSLPVRNTEESVPSQAPRDAAIASPSLSRTAVVPSIVSFPAITPTQGSPPTPAEPKYLLIQVFLI